MVIFSYYAERSLSIYMYWWNVLPVTDIWVYDSNSDVTFSTDTCVELGA